MIGSARSSASASPCDTGEFCAAPHRMKPEPIGQMRWAIAEGYIPAWSHGKEPELTSHETACLLNTNDRDAHVEITIYYSDREPVGPYQVLVPARRT